MINSRESSKGVNRCKSNCRFVQDSVIGPIDVVNLYSLIPDDSPYKIRIPQYSRVWREEVRVANIAPFFHVSHATVYGAGGLFPYPVLLGPR
jgi:hypothetical protein